MADSYYTKAEFLGYKTVTDKKIADLQLAILGFNPEYPISLTDLGTDVTSYYNPAKYYLKGEPIAAGDLPSNIPTKSYVDSQTRGVTSAVPAYLAIDELVAARQGQVSLLINLNLYSTKAALITNINALSSGTINVARIATIPHSSLSGLTSTGCHPQSAITDLTTDLGNKATSASIIAVINATAEVTEIGHTHLQYKPHTHPQSDITNLTTDLSGINSAISGLNTSVTDILTGGYATTDEYFDCLYSVLVAMAGLLSYSFPACWKVRP